MILNDVLILPPNTLLQPVSDLMEDRHIRGRAVDSEQPPEDAMPLPQPLISDLRPTCADSPASLKQQPSLFEGDVIGGLTIVKCIQALEDIEIYEVCGHNEQTAVLKIACSGAERAAEAIMQEARALASLDATALPRLLRTGKLHGRPYLLMAWLAGNGVDFDVRTRAACAGQKVI